MAERIITHGTREQRECNDPNVAWDQALENALQTYIPRSVQEERLARSLSIKPVALIPQEEAA